MAEKGGTKKKKKILIIISIITWVFSVFFFTYSFFFLYIHPPPDINEDLTHQEIDEDWNWFRNNLNNQFLFFILSGIFFISGIVIFIFAFLIDNKGNNGSGNDG